MDLIKIINFLVGVLVGMILIAISNFTMLNGQPGGIKKILLKKCPTDKFIQGVCYPEKPVKMFVDENGKVSIAWE